VFSPTLHDFDLEYRAGHDFAVVEGGEFLLHRNATANMLRTSNQPGLVGDQ
jgi:hypothetical protein